MKKRRIGLIGLACLTAGIGLAGCVGSSEQPTETTTTAEITTAEVTQADIEKMIIGSWIVAERKGQPALTNEKSVFTFESPTKAYVSASFNARPELGIEWLNMLESEVEIKGNKVTITRKGGGEATMVNELTISNITDAETRGDLVSKLVDNGKETVITEEQIRFVKVKDDYSKDILGTWEGHCTSEGSVYDDGQEHRWEYKEDGTYVYYHKDGDNWVPSDDKLNDYFVDGNLLCTRWGDGNTEDREWWEITVDGDTMNWTALRENEGGSTFTATFEMNKVK